MAKHYKILIAKLLFHQQNIQLHHVYKNYSNILKTITFLYIYHKIIEKEEIN